MKAFIFAAGLGTRLKPLTDTMPKALVEVGGKPLLEQVMTNLAQQGADEFIVNVHHFPEQIISFLNSPQMSWADSAVSDESEALLDTGGALKRAQELLRGCGHFIAHNVDILSNLDLPSFVGQCRPDALATLVVSERKTQRYLLFDPSTLRLVGWTNLATSEIRTPFAGLNPDHCLKLAFAGIHYISEEILPILEDWPDKFSIMDFYLSECAEKPIYAYIPDGFEVMDVGKAATLPEADSFLEKISAR